MNKISIALCTYNGAKFLEEQLASFSRQTRLPDELIVCDDRSSDATVEIIEEFARAARFPVTIHVNETNLGSTTNFERALSLCTGDLIFLADQDDVWFPNKLERFAAEFERSEKIGMVFSDAALVGENLEPLGHNLWDVSFTPEERRKAQSGRMLEVLLKRNVVTGATMAFRASLRKVFSPIPVDIPNTIHDAWIALMISTNAEISFIEENFILYRQHAAQQLGIDWKYKEKIKERMKKLPRRERYAEAIGCEEKEIARLRKLADILKFHPQFQNKEAEVLLDGISTSFMEESRQKARHYEARKNLPPNRLRRISPIIKELWTNRYRRFSKGFLSAGKDLLEKW